MDGYYQMLIDALGMFLFLGIELSVLFILISFGVGLLQQFIPDSKVQAILSGKKGWGYIFAAALGAITPFCSCSTIPMLRGLLKAKAGFGPTMTFLFCSPLLNPIIIGLFLATFGAKITVWYMVIALVVSIVAAFILDAMHFEQYVIPESENGASSCCGSTGDTVRSEQKEAVEQAHGIQSAVASCCSPAPLAACCTAQPEKPVAPTPSPCCGLQTAPTPSCCGSSSGIREGKVSFGQRCGLAYREAMRQFKSVLVYLLIGVALGAFVYGFVPSDFIAANANGTKWYAIPVAAIIGIPLYVRTEVLIPLSAVLVEKGMGLGAIMALIIGGGGASITELILLKSMFRMPMILAFLLVILGMAVSAGCLFQYLS